jgi:hypothetical protein
MLGRMDGGREGERRRRYRQSKKGGEMENEVAGSLEVKTIGQVPERSLVQIPKLARLKIMQFCPCARQQLLPGC